MSLNPVIKPEVLNVLCSNPETDKKVAANNTPPPEPKPSRWQRVKNFLKKSWGGLLAVAAIIPPILNAISRLIESFKKPSSGSRNHRRCHA